MSGPSQATVAVVVAAGSGERLGAAVPKALVPLAGRSLLAHTLDRLERSAAVDAVVVVHTPGYESAFEEVCHDHDVAALVPGAETRSGSVRAGVGAASPDATRIAVHDAARALTPPEVIARVVGAVSGDTIAAAPGLPVPDTLKRVRGGAVTATLERTDVWAVHTPQVIDGRVLRAVLDWAGTREATDDLGLVERAIAAGVVEGGRVVVVEGDPLDLKITYPRDLRVAEDLLRSRAPVGPGSST